MNSGGFFLLAPHDQVLVMANFANTVHRQAIKRLLKSGSALWRDLTQEATV